MSKEAPFPALVSFCPYIRLAITFCEGSTVEKRIYGPINKLLQTIEIHVKHKGCIIIEDQNSFTISKLYHP